MVRRVNPQRLPLSRRMTVSAVSPRRAIRPPVALKKDRDPNLQSVTEARTILQWNSNFFSLLKNAHRVTCELLSFDI